MLGRYFLMINILYRLLLLLHADCIFHIVVLLLDKPAKTVAGY